MSEAYVVVRNLRLPAGVLAAVDAEAGTERSRSAVVAEHLAKAYPEAVAAGWQYQGRRASRWRGAERPVADRQETLDFGG